MRSRYLSRALLLFVVAQLMVTVAYVLRPIPLPTPVRSAVTSYMEPVFRQSWSVFAPDPVSYSTWLEVRGKNSAEAATPWFDVSACDIDSAIRHHAVPNRRYLTTFQLVKHYRGSRDALGGTAQRAATGDGTPSQRQATVRANGVPQRAAAAFSRSDTAMTALAAQVAKARFGAVEQVQIRIVDTHFVRFDVRDDPAARGRTDTWTSGWSPAHDDRFSATGAASVASLYGPGAGCSPKAEGGRP